MSFYGFSQENLIDSIQIDQIPVVFLKGQIVNGFDKKPLPGAHVFNMNSVRGTVTLNDGTFSIPTRVNDTIFFTHLGFQSVKIKISNDLLKGNELEIALYEKAENIAEVNVKSTKLVGVLEIDARNVPTDTYSRIHINGLPQTYEVGRPREKTYNSTTDAIFHPIDFVYNLFGKKPKQLRKLKEMRENHQVRDMLNEKVNREVMLDYLELSQEELSELLEECNYSDYFITEASDIQIIEAVLECYENHKAVKKGSTKKKE
ncbi:TonB-dependent receptor [Urechidicola croceus]|uniref:TonB-dependent receptor n=1 Tax=Urechidicola croceus TaxID=1850246 RepID=A0A1D8PBN8_9FLAO|nr:TonB-dependent receptor [Urechidicola croceus]